MDPSERGPSGGMIGDVFVCVLTVWCCCMLEALLRDFVGISVSSICRKNSKPEASSLCVRGDVRRTRGDVCCSGDVCGVDSGEITSLGWAQAGDGGKSFRETF